MHNFWVCMFMWSYFLGYLLRSRIIWSDGNHIFAMFVVVCAAGGHTQGLMHARHLLYHWAVLLVLCSPLKNLPGFLTNICTIFYSSVRVCISSSGGFQFPHHPHWLLLFFCSVPQGSVFQLAGLLYKLESQGGRLQWMYWQIEMSGWRTILLNICNLFFRFILHSCTWVPVIRRGYQRPWN